MTGPSARVNKNGATSKHALRARKKRHSGTVQPGTPFGDRAPAVAIHLAALGPHHTICAGPFADADHRDRIDEPFNHMLDVEDTIVAIASPTSPAPRGIVRLSGCDLMSMLSTMGALGDPTSPNASNASPRRFSADIDLGLPLGTISIDVLLWPTTRSYTGQPSAEFHTFGSLPILQSLVECAIRSGARAARPGEFTMRAFLAGRLDLTQAEAVLGVIEADGRGSLDHALSQLAGNLSRPLEKMRGEMLDLLADVEAGLDFVDEDIEFVSDEMLIDRLTAILAELDETRQRMKARSGGAARTTIALRGRPNAGKSRLINAITGHDASIVADLAGTTRDAVTIDAEIDHHPVKWIDTAGIETATSDVSAMSQRRAEDASSHADVRIWCVDCSRDDFAESCRKMERQIERSHSRRAVDLRVITKADLKADLKPDSEAANGWASTSAATGAGVEQLRRQIAIVIESRLGEETGSVVGTAARCGQSLIRAHAAIHAAIELARGRDGHEFVAAELRSAVTCLGEVTGAVYTDDILDRVFGRFCIGK